MVAHWCRMQRDIADEYLSRQPITFGALGASPAWYLPPYVSLWAVESIQARGKVGWWVICGDLPTDYVSGLGNENPRAAVAAFANRWLEIATAMESGQSNAQYSIGSEGDANELAPALRARAQILAEWAADDTIWED